MKEKIIALIQEYPAITSTIVGITIILIAVLTLSSDPTPQELEQKLKEEITQLDTERTTRTTEYQAEVDKYTECINTLKSQLGTTKPIEACVKKVGVVQEANANSVVEAPNSNTGSVKVEAPLP